MYPRFGFVPGNFEREVSQSRPPFTGVLKWEILESALGSAPENAPGNRNAPGSAPESAQGNWGCSRECSRECSMWGVNLRFPRRQTGARIPISWKRGFRGPKTAISPRPCKGWKREFSVQKSPFSMCSLVEKWGYLDRKLPFPAFSRTRGNGGFWTPKPSFPGNGDSGPLSGVGGIASVNRKSTLRSTPWSTPNFPEHSQEHEKWLSERCSERGSRRRLPGDLREVAFCDR